MIDSGILFNYYGGILFRYYLHGTEALFIIEYAKGKENPYYLQLLKNLFFYNSELGDYSEAVRLGTEILDFMERVPGKVHPDYAELLHKLAELYYRSGNYAEAVRLGTEALNIRESVLGKNHTDYASTLNNLVLYNSGFGNYAESLRLGFENVAAMERIHSKESAEYATSLSGLALCYSNLSNYTEAIRIATEALYTRERVVGKDHPDYVESLNNLAMYNAEIGKYSEAIRLGAEALNIIERNGGKENMRYADVLHNLASYKADLGIYDEAIRYGSEVLKIKEQISGTETLDYANTLSNMAGYYYRIYRYREPVQLGTEALNIIERVLGKDNLPYATALNNLALYHYGRGNYDKAVESETEALEIMERVIGKEHPNYAIMLSNLASYNAYIDNFTKAIKLEKEALDIKKRLLSKRHPEYIQSLQNLSLYELSNHQSGAATNHAMEATELVSGFVRKTFSDLTFEERTNFWATKKEWFEDWINRISYSAPTRDIVSSSYDGTLLAKGILLNSERDFSQLIQESGDAEALELFNVLRNTKLMLNRLYEKPIAERALSTDSLEKVAADLERELIGRSKVYGDFTRNMAIGWRDVQRSLDKNDVAVEFVCFPDEENITTYAAYVIRPGMAAPKMVTLFKKNSLDNISPAQYYRNDRLSRLVWQGLDKYLADAKNVYFAPAGELYNIAIESLPDYREGKDSGDENSSGTSLLSDRLNLYRLSSTRELAVIKDKGHIDKSVLYGGLKYNTDAEVLRQDAERYPQDAERSFDGFFDYDVSLADSLQMRAGVKDLPGTLEEVTNIQSTLRNRHIDCRSFTGLDGTEGSFKALSGKGVNHLHIATHGFYWTESEAERKGCHLLFMSMGGDELTGRGHRNVEDKALTRSGLLLAGANVALTGQPLPENAQDGILTAREIAGMDLRGMDMVVLSACQTGLGEISGDGVFGLQRGFKKAGANTLLMSLWKVDDKATQLLMTKFYDDLLSGRGKHDALLSAQRFVREHTETRGTGASAVTVCPYAHPRYWAAFILLDAIDNPWASQN